MIVSCSKLWRPCSAAQYLTAEIRLIKSFPATPKFRIRQCEGLHTIEYLEELEDAAGTAKDVLVVLPGFGSVAAFFVMAIPPLARKYRVVCIDWMGTGGSDRPDYRCQPGQDAEAFFVDSLEAWRHAMGLEKMVLVGHSLGAILAASYSLRFPVSLNPKP